MKKNLFIMFLVLVLSIGVTACNNSKKVSKVDGKYNIVATTTMIADLVNIIGGDNVDVKGLMGPGVDPHLYKASAGDVSLMQNADMVFYNGIHLEGKMGEVFENLNGNGKLVIEIASGIDEEDLIVSEDDLHDPHIWFNVLLWKDAAKVVRDGLIDFDKENESTYNDNYEAYIKELDELHEYVKSRVEELPESKRILITAHDAFEYFGSTYGFKVKGLQGISTASEAGTADVRELAEFIVKHKIGAIFIESSVPKKNVEALQEAVKARGFEVEIGGELFSDSLGSEGTEAETYIGTVKSNVNTIVDALK
ncbi:metal ABC transporter solute-binding protein, Zn/Mn family [Vallitalea sp.]|jgi:manganese/zinc/iron transport system substrate-binding protein|uniref:metal ABC transporter solute-binding protein, Zn/Mn family n=1 Tax=Vallitalea sp. TaxID=1882829 RepID=UPI002600D8AD|nr:zinc ABC transporter substrate-binding protein [Vallitalea sp.]MCT4686926.1 zinc ABC transporter substrate-binding protein [Vallitalea sp.]